MAYITTPTKAYTDNESHGGADNLTNLQSAIEHALQQHYVTVVDSSLYFTAPDTSVYVWTVAKV